MTTIEAIYIGSMSDLDPDESNSDSENAGDLVGLTFGSSEVPLYDSTGALTFDDTNGDGSFSDNDSGNIGDDLIYNGTASTLDSSLVYDVTVNFSNGTSATTSMIALQDVSGRVFLAPFNAGSSYNEVLDDFPITSIHIDYVVGSNYGGVSGSLEQDAFITCFAAGTLIATQKGQIDIAQLSVGDRVCTMDHGYQPIRWIRGRRERAIGKFAPIRIAKGALGQGLPSRDLRVSPQHRILVRSKIARRMFGCFEVLLAAKKMLGMPGITVDHNSRHITYWHFLFDHHEIVFSEGAATESFYTGPEVMRSLDTESTNEIFALFPELAERAVLPTAARPIVQGKRQKRLLERHKKNSRLIYQDCA